MLTLEERERRAYIEGRVEEAQLLALAMAEDESAQLHIKDLEDQVTSLEDEILKLEGDIEDLEAKLEDDDA